MKKILICAIALFCLTTSTTAQTAKEVQKQRKEIYKMSKEELNQKATKDARKAAKEYKKEGWKAAPGALPLEKQLDRLYLMRMEVDADMYPKYLTGEAMSIAESYDAAKIQAMELARLNLAGQLQSEVTALVENSVGNQQMSREEAASITQTIMESKALFSQTNLTKVENQNGQSNIDFSSYGGSEVKGEWIETVKGPHFENGFVDGLVVVKVSARGKIREIVSSKVEFDSRILRNGTEDRYEADRFREGDDIYISFAAPVDGYVAAYLIDNENTAYCLLPYKGQKEGNVRVEAGKRYVFGSVGCAAPEEKPIVDEYFMTCSQQQEVNQLYVVFSPNAFYKKVDCEIDKGLPRMLSAEAFQEWLSACRMKDPQMNVSRKILTVTKK